MSVCCRFNQCQRGAGSKRMTTLNCCQGDVVIDAGPSCSHMIRVQKNCGSSQRTGWCSIEQVCQDVKSSI